MTDLIKHQLISTNHYGKTLNLKIDGQTESYLKTKCDKIK